MKIKRGNFSSRMGFVAAAAGSAVGLGNIWKFPFETGESGGAAFLLIYLICVFLLGFPIMVAEISLGRKTNLNPYGAYKKVGNKWWGLVGLYGIICGFMILSFYNVVAGWAFGFFVQIIGGDLMQAEQTGAFFSSYVSNIGNNAIYSFCFMIATALVVAGGVQKGIEKTTKVLMPLLIIILFSLIFYGLTLDNAMEGIAFYLIPDFGKLSGNTVYAALGQAFFSLSLGMGGLITYGSYVSKKENIVGAATIVTLADSFIAFLAGLMIFPLVFSQHVEPTAGPGLVFVTLPAIFQTMGPVFGKVVGASFFLLLCFAALTSTISLMEVPTAFLVDEKKWSRKKSVTFLAITIFLMGLPSMLANGAVEWLTNFVTYDHTSKSFMDLVIDVFSDISLPFGGFLLALFVATKWKSAGLSEEITSGYPNYKGSLIEKYLNLMITRVCPVILGIMFIMTVSEKFFGLTFMDLFG